jgi:hypothetical protein
MRLLLAAVWVRLLPMTFIHTKESGLDKERVLRITPLPTSSTETPKVEETVQPLVAQNRFIQPSERLQQTEMALALQTPLQPVTALLQPLAAAHP